MSKNSVYRTNNVDLASFLVFEGIQLETFEKDTINPKIVYMVFSDPMRKCIDLERVFLNSHFKRYKDINKWLLKKIHEKMRE